MEASATSALDQLSGFIADIRTTVVTHYQTLIHFGVPPNAAAEMSAEVQSTLLEVLFPPKPEVVDD